MGLTKQFVVRLVKAHVTGARDGLEMKDKKNNTEGNVFVWHDAW